MKKISKALVTWALISLIIVPIVASAQMPKECCKVNRTYPDFTCGEGTVISKTGTSATERTLLNIGEKVIGQVWGTPGTPGLEVVGPSVGAMCPEGVVTCPTKDWGTICLMETVYNITDWIFYIVLTIAVIIGVVAGVQFMTSSGDPAKTEKARNLLLYMVIGLAVAALAKVIPAIVRTVVGI